MATTYPVTQSTVLPERRVITLEQGVYVLLGVLSIIAHLYLLGGRALHHDETLHAQYSWRVYQGDGYFHDPLLHGPVLYYVTALMYLLFGATDTTARLGAALFGMVAVLLPVFLRREMGRGGALLACAYLLISPVFLYVGRFIRHDIFAVTFELIAVIGLIRYIHTERSGWHYLFAAAMGLMIATMETFYLFLLIIGSYIVVKLLWDVAPRALGLLVGYVVLLGAILKLLPKLSAVGPIPLVTESQALEVRNAPDNNWSAYFAKVGPVVGRMLWHPATLAALVLTLLLAFALWWMLWHARDDGGQSAWRRAADAARPGTLLHAVDRIRLRQWLLAILVAFTIYAVFFMSLLSQPGRPNTTGIVTGVLGSFLYWLGQHGVRRGGQPAHFYLFEIALYDPLLLLFGAAGMALVLRRTVRQVIARNQNVLAGVSLARRTVARWGADDPGAFLGGLLAWWSLMSLAIYSWAGEKMPWLTIHIVLPFALLSAWTLARLGAWAFRDGISRVTLLLMGMATALIAPALLLLNITTADPQRVGQVWFWPLLIILSLALLVSGATVLGGARQGLASGLCAILVLLVPLTIRSSIRLVYVNGDVPVEPMVYVQTSPDVPRVMQDLQRVALLHGSRFDLPIRYDNETIWQWYLRDYTNTEGSGGQVLGSITDDVQAVFLLDENLQANEAQLEGFVRQRYPLRWWFPECEVYRFPTTDKECGPDPGGSSTLQRFLQRPWDGAAISGIWQFWLNRRLPAPLGSADWILEVRPEIADQFGLGGVVNP